MLKKVRVALGQLARGEESETSIVLLHLWLGALLLAAIWFY